MDSPRVLGYVEYDWLIKGIVIFTPIELDLFKRCEEAIEVVIAHYLGHQRNLRTAWGGWELLTVDRRPCSALIIVWSTVKDVTPISSFKVFPTGYCSVVLNGFFTKKSFFGEMAKVASRGLRSLGAASQGSLLNELRSHLALPAEVPCGAASWGPILRKSRSPAPRPQAEVTCGAASRGSWGQN